MISNEVGYNSKVEGEVIVTRADAVINWIQETFGLAHAYGACLLCH